MGQPFEQHRRAEVPASPEQVWEAIATGPGITSWFMGRTEVEAGLVRTVFGGYAPELAVSAEDRPHRFRYGSDPAPDGRFIAYEFLIEARAGASTIVRTVTSGFLPGDDWADEYEAMTLGTDFFFATLVEYLTSFPGRHATPVTAFGPEGRDWPSTRTGLAAGLGLAEPVTAGAPTHSDLGSLGDIAGTVYFASPHAIGIRTGNALVRFLEGFQKGHVAAHLFFEPIPDTTAAEQAWAAWLAQFGQ